MTNIEWKPKNKWNARVLGDEIKTTRFIENLECELCDVWEEMTGVEKK